MTDDLITLASAYLDGETTPAERARVEAAPGLLAEVERLRQVRAVLGATESAAISTRERHLAGALDTWDRLPSSEKLGDATPVGDDAAGAAGGASITAPTSLRDRRTRRQPVSTRVLTAAAAVVVLAGAGVVIRGALDTGGDDIASTAEVIDEAGDSIDDAASAELETTPLDAAAETFEQDGAAADEPVIAPVPEPAPGAIAVQGGPEEPPNNDDLEILSGDAELAEFANRKVISRTSPTDAPAEAAESGVATDGAADDTAPDTTLAPPVDLCGLVDEFVGFALWQTPGAFDDAIAVGINNPTGEAVAYRDDTCTVVARAPLPDL